jgi:hypothetical protein
MDDYLHGPSVNDEERDFVDSTLGQDQVRHELTMEMEA